jgi:hypothetical protein
MANKPKYEKLVKGERKAVRKSGVKKMAKKGEVGEIYTAAKGGAMVTSGKSNKGSGSTVQGAVQLTGRTAKDKLKPVVGTQEQKAAQFERQAQINQAGFEKTRLGSRIVRKAEAAARAKGGRVRRTTATVASKKKK